MIRNPDLDRPPGTQQWILDLGFTRWTNSFRPYSTAYTKVIGYVSRPDEPNENQVSCQILLYHNGLRNPNDDFVSITFQTEFYKQDDGRVIELINRGMSEEDFKKLFPQIEAEAMAFYGLPKE